MSKPVEFTAFDNYQGPAAWAINKREMMTPEAEFAWHFIEKWGMVAGVPDGEDSAGRQKLRVATPAEIVQRATETAEGFWQAIQAKGWVQDIPSQEEAAAKVEELRKERKANRE